MQCKNKNLVDDYMIKMLSQITNNAKLFNIFQKILLDNELHMHSIDVAKLSTQIAITLNLSDRDIKKISLAGYMHDSGKIVIDSSILYKPDRLSDAEFEIIKKHPVDGYNYLKQAGISEDICQMVLKHHEKKSGKGYPEGIAKKTMPQEIITVADIFCALSEKRSYHNALTYRQALEFVDSFEDLDKDILQALKGSFAN